MNKKRELSRVQAVPQIFSPELSRICDWMRSVESFHLTRKIDEDRVDAQHLPVRMATAAFLVRRYMESMYVDPSCENMDVLCEVGKYHPNIPIPEQRHPRDPRYISYTNVRLWDVCNQLIHADDYSMVVAFPSPVGIIDESPIKSYTRVTCSSDKNRVFESYTIGVIELCDAIDCLINTPLIQPSPETISRREKAESDQYVPLEREPFSEFLVYKVGNKDDASPDFSFYVYSREEESEQRIKLMEAGIYGRVRNMRWRPGVTRS